MAARREIREMDLLEYSRCLLRKPEGAPYVLPADVIAAELAAKKVFLLAFTESRVPGASEVRELYERAWNEAVGFDPDLRTPPRSGLAVCRRLRDILLRYEIQQPVTKYILNLGRATISGEYAVVVDSKRRKDGLFVLRWRHKAERVARQLIQSVDVVNYARWLHLRNIETHELDLGVLNLALDADESWIERISGEKLVRRSLSFLVESIVGDQGFPSTGEHCRSCQTNACQPRNNSLVDLRSLLLQKA
jgi:hypothetical protein